MNVSLVPSSSSIALDVDSLSTATATAGGGLAASAAEGAQALSELPGESWLAAGLGNVGVTLAGDVQALHGLASLITSLGGSSGAGATTEESSSSGFNIKGVLEGFLTPLSALSAPGAQSQHDFLSWMSSAGLFASGSGIVNLRGGIVLDSKDPSLSKAAVAKLGAALEKSGGSVQPISIPGTDAAISARVNGLPVELDIANGVGSDGQTKFVIGLGEASVQDALKPSSTLLSAASTSTAAGTLGEGITAERDRRIRSAAHAARRGRPQRRPEHLPRPALPALALHARRRRQEPRRRDRALPARRRAAAVGLSAQRTFSTL